jgi:predicted O-methyltransferase YrrM
VFSVTQRLLEQWTRVDRYFTDLLVRPDPNLQAALEASDAAGLPQIQVAANQGKFLMMLARAQGARRILEIGTLGGYSTIWLARALPPDGRLVTLEAVPTHAKVARQNIDRAGLAENVEVRLGRALDTLPQLAAEGLGPFDFIFLDADKRTYPEYLEWCIKLSRRGTMIVADNVVRSGEVVDTASRDTDVQGVRRFLELLSIDQRLSATAIQTVGAKGYDGIALAVMIKDP